MCSKATFLSILASALRPIFEKMRVVSMYMAVSISNLQLPLPVSDLGDLIYVYCLWHCTGLDCRNFGLVVAAK